MTKTFVFPDAGAALYAAALIGRTNRVKASRERRGRWCVTVQLQPRSARVNVD